MTETKKIKLEELLEVKQSFDKIINADIDISVALDIERKIRKIVEEYVLYDKVNGKLVTRLGVPSGMGKYQIKDDNFDEYMKEHHKLINTEIEVSYERVSLKSIVSQDIKVSVKDINRLNDYVLDDIAVEEKKKNK